jgi:hypothetical protein
LNEAEKTDPEILSIVRRAATSSLFNNFKHDFLIGSRCDGVKDRSEGLGGTALFSYDSSEILLGHSQRDQRGRGSSRFFNFDRFRVADQLLRYELDPCSA